MIRVRCFRCGEWVYEFFCCEAGGPNGEDYYCQNCANKKGITDGPYVLNKSRFYNNTGSTTKEEQHVCYYASALQKIKHKLSKILNKSI